MFDCSSFRVEPGVKIDLPGMTADFTGPFKSKTEAKKHTQENIEKMIELQSRLYAESAKALLVVFQGMDAAGKDSAIRHVMSGLNPQGTSVHSFRQPSPEELSHDYLWRYVKNLPEKGRIGIFNRSYYEEALAVRVHQIAKARRVPDTQAQKDFWKERLHQMRGFEKYLHTNGTIVVKFFLNLSKEEQKKRLIERLEDKTKNWNFSVDDMREREFWDDYIRFYEEAIQETSTTWAPWYIVPSDKKWFSRLAVSEIVMQTLRDMKPEYPRLNREQLKIHKTMRERLLNT
ncbi:MAG: polyphosphate kinase 2 family protein [Firmicutes bacterium]|nr:polyphosphate kinase 2 family protein [Bacillota bacterium]